MDLLPPEPSDFWKFRLVGGRAVVTTSGGLALVADSDMSTVAGMATAAGGAALVALSVVGFLYYWRRI